MLLCRRGHRRCRRHPPLLNPTPPEPAGTATLHLRAFARAAKDDANAAPSAGRHTLDSPEVSGTYTVRTGRAGRLFLVPHFAADPGHSSLAVEFDLDTWAYRLEQLWHYDIHTDFADYYSEYHDGYSSVAVTHGYHENARENVALPPTRAFSYAAGTKPYPGCLASADLRHLAAPATLAGFWGGFRAADGAGKQYGFLVPYFNGDAYSGHAVRVDLEKWRPAAQAEPAASRPAAVAAAAAVVDLTGGGNDPELVGFSGGFSHGGYAYFVPLFDGVGAGHVLARVPVGGGATETLDVRAALNEPRAAGFRGGFVYTSAVTGATHAYLVPYVAALCCCYYTAAPTTAARPFATFAAAAASTPADSSSPSPALPSRYRHDVAPVGHANSRKSADGHDGLGAFDERSAVGGGHRARKYHGLVVRVNLDDFATVDSLDLERADRDLRGFSSGFAAGTSGYLVPFRNRDDAEASPSAPGSGGSGHFGKLVKIDLERFGDADAADGGGVRVLDLRKVDRRLAGFVHGFVRGDAAYLVPYANGATETNHLKRAQHALLTRVSLNGFSPDDVTFVDVSASTRQQVPNAPDPELRGFSHGVSAGGCVARGTVVLPTSPRLPGTCILSRISTAQGRQESLCASTPATFPSWPRSSGPGRRDCARPSPRRLGRRPASGRRPRRTRRRGRWPWPSGRARRRSASAPPPKCRPTTAPSPAPTCWASGTTACRWPT